ncbi:DUF1353 domain-containing protein [Agromyces soli]
MPFFEMDDGAEGRYLEALPIAQRPLDGYRFDLRAPFVYRDPVTERRFVVPARTRGDARELGRTDLASVPPLLWSLIASYGRQSAPAVLHDHRSRLADERAAAGDRRGALLQRRDDDRVFRTALREQHVPLLRAWLMWAWVSADRERVFGGAAGIAFVVQAIVGALLVLAAAVLAWWSPAWLGLAVLPAIAALPWGRAAGLQLLLACGSAVLAPLLVLQLAAVLPFRLIEAIVELLSGGEPGGVWRPTLRREASRH